MKPFNLEEALAGKAVKLRNGSKAYVRHHETTLKVANDWQLQGIKEDGDLVAWALDGSNSNEEMGYVEDEIIGMYPETRIINGFEVPLPAQAAPSHDTEYYIPFPTSLYFYDERQWFDDTYDERVLERGLVFLNKEDAIATAKAMLGIDPYTKEMTNETI